MSALLWLTEKQMARLRPFFPKRHGKPRVDDRRVLSDIIFVNRNRQEEKRIKPCIRGWKFRGKPVKYDKKNYKHRNRIEIMFRQIRDWRRVATRYDRNPIVFFSAICLPATVMFWL